MLQRSLELDKLPDDIHVDVYTKKSSIILTQIVNYYRYTVLYIPKKKEKICEVIDLCF